MTDNTERYSDFVLDQSPPEQEFDCQVLYDPDGDCIEFLISQDDFYAERIDSLVTVYYSQENGEITGALIKGLKNIIRDLSDKIPGFQIEIEDGQVKLQYIFTAQLWSSKRKPAEHAVITYKKLRKFAEERNATAELSYL